MKPFGKKRDHPLDLPASGLTGRQLTAIAVAFALAVVLMPVGARAAQIVSAIITDPTNASNQAHVDASGNLQVGGSVNVGNFPATQAVSGSVDILGQVATHPAVPTNAFDFSILVSGDQYLDNATPPVTWNITSLDVANENPAPVSFELVATNLVANTCSSPAGTTPMVSGVVPAQDTATLTFPVPAFQTRACLFARASGGSVVFTVIGYTS